MYVEELLKEFDRSNQVYVAPGRIPSQSKRQWSQVFDLQNETTVLVCNVLGDELSMNLIHLTDDGIRKHISQNRREQTQEA